MGPFSFLERVVILCAKHGGSVSSWGRTEKHNREVGGVDGSDHLLWIGCDVVLDDMSRNGAFEADCGRLDLSALFEGDHYHLRPK